MLLRVTFALVAGLVIAGSGVAKDMQIGSATLSLPAPEGYCELTDQQPLDANMIKLIGSLLTNTELLMMSADCRQLQAWRAEKQPALDDYAQYQTRIRSKDSNFPRAESIKQACAAMRSQGDKTAAGMASDLNARLDTVLKGTKFNETGFLGVLAEDADACYYGLLLKMRDETGAEKTQVTIAAVTFVKGKIILYNLYTVYRGADTVKAALARHQRNVPALLSANGG